MIPVLLKTIKNASYDDAIKQLTITNRSGKTSYPIDAISYLRTLNPSHSYGVKSLCGKYALVLTRYEVYQIIDTFYRMPDFEIEKLIKENHNEYYVSIAYRKIENLISSKPYIMHNGSFEANGRVSNGLTTHSMNGNPNFVYLKFGDTWSYNTDNNALIKRMDGRGYYEYYGDTFITIVKPNNQSHDSFSWKIEMDPYVVEDTKTLDGGDIELRNVEMEHLKSLLKNISNKYGIKYQRICKMLSYYILNMPSGVSIKMMDLEKVVFDDIELNRNWLDNLKNHIIVFNLKDDGKNKEVFETLVTIMFVLNHKIKNLKEYRFNRDYIMKGFLFDVIDIFDRAEI